MQFIIDHAASIIVASLVFLALIAINRRDRETTIETINYNALNKQELSFINTLKRDLQGVSKVVTTEEDPYTKTFTFFAQVDSTDTTKVEIAYKRVFVEKRDTVDLYQIQRLEKKGGTMVASGASMPTIPSWTIRALNEDVQPAYLTTDARRIHVRYEAVAPCAEEQTVGRAGWEATFHPPLLRSLNGIF